MTKKLIFEFYSDGDIIEMTPIGDYTLLYHRTWIFTFYDKITDVTTYSEEYEILLEAAQAAQEHYEEKTREAAK